VVDRLFDNEEGGDGIRSGGSLLWALLPSLELEAGFWAGRADVSGGWFP